MNENLLNKIQEQLLLHFTETRSSHYFYGFITAAAINSKHIMESRWIQLLLKKGLSNSDRKTVRGSHAFVDFLKQTSKDMVSNISQKKYSLCSAEWDNRLKSSCEFSCGFFECAELWTTFDFCMHNDEFNTIVTPICHMNYPEFYSYFEKNGKMQKDKIVKNALSSFPSVIYKIYDFMQNRQPAKIEKIRRKKGKLKNNSLFSYTYTVS
ncbi:MAG: hypothetical protein PF637_10675 [Spirochaetes bacterium]|jgi:hypothetical protein|nr:hypothetical protein [Spirochaetota bacterium]